MHEAGELVAGEQHLLQLRVARNLEMLGVGEDRLDQLLGVALLPQDRRAVLRMLVERGVDLVVEVVEERGRAPELLVLAVQTSVVADGRLDRERVAEEGLVRRVPSERLPRLVSARPHGAVR